MCKRWRRCYTEGALIFDQVYSINSSTICNGGFVCTSNGCSITILNSVIVHSRADGQGGGAIFYGVVDNLSSNLFIANSSFQYCYATSTQSFGGAVFSLSNLSVSNSSFSDCTADYGGALMLGGSSALISNTSFTNNKAGLSGGAISSIGNPDSNLYSSLTIINRSLFQNNLVQSNQSGVDYSGGAMALSNTYCFINTTALVMSNNSAPLANGIILLDNSSVYYNAEMADIENGNSLNVGADDAIFLANTSYAINFAKHNPFPPTVYLDSYPVGLALSNDSVGLNGSMITNYEIPSFTFNMANVFGTATTFHPNVSYVIGVSNVTTSDGGTAISTRYTIPPVSGQQLIHFKKSQIPTSFITPTFGGNITIDFSILFIVDSEVQSAQHYPFYLQLSECTAPSNKIVQMTDSPTNKDGKIQYSCLPVYNISSPTRISFASIALVFLILGVCLVIRAQLTAKALIRIRFRVNLDGMPRSRLSNTLIILGCLLQFTAVSINLISSNLVCMMTEWLDLTGFTILAMAVIMKSVQMKTIFLGSASFKGFDRPLSNTLYLVYTSVAVCFTLGFLGIWNGVAPLVIIPQSVSATQQFVQTDLWSSSNAEHKLIFNTLSIFIRLGLTITASIMTYQLRHVDSVQAESGRLAWICYSWLISYLILFAIEYVVPLYPSMTFAVRMLRSLLPTALTIILLFIPIKPRKGGVSGINGQQRRYQRQYFSSSADEIKDSIGRSTGVFTSGENNTSADLFVQHDFITTSQKIGHHDVALSFDAEYPASSSNDNTDGLTKLD